MAVALSGFFKKRGQIHSFPDPNNFSAYKDLQLCDNGKEFFNLTSKDFEHCKSCLKKLIFNLINLIKKINLN